MPLDLVLNTVTAWTSNIIRLELEFCIRKLDDIESYEKPPFRGGWVSLKDENIYSINSRRNAPA
jgi:hypothetical protein